MSILQRRKPVGVRIDSANNGANAIERQFTLSVIGSLHMLPYCSLTTVVDEPIVLVQVHRNDFGRLISGDLQVRHPGKDALLRRSALAESRYP